MRCSLLEDYLFGFVSLSGTRFINPFVWVPIDWTCCWQLMLRLTITMHRQFHVSLTHVVFNSPGCRWRTVSLRPEVVSSSSLSFVVLASILASLLLLSMNCLACHYLLCLYSSALVVFAVPVFIVSALSHQVIASRFRNWDLVFFIWTFGDLIATALCTRWNRTHAHCGVWLIRARKGMCGLSWLSSIVA